ncbi:MarR family transcriptional regulator [Sporanaerobium hydrogeniformans]|uniref:MarR family transcriptional regulator n=1 Tax=Sporanaerobium hydrogeniformans TaxID=3072179 RepID=A0AC61D8F2_9FIRM|nr:MarR family transcriptional regulator [Sporanaerobium hydrogeniformans]PHV69699.1 MarR family transcriptional regulator [Sporanaerobium hydrogeniformans]
MQEEMRLGILLKMVNNVFERSFNTQIAKINLTAAQCDILGFLHANEDKEINPIDIERQFKLKRPTVTGLLKRLEAKGFIQLMPSSKDNRYKQIVLTDKAQTHQQEMLAGLAEMENRLYKGISEEEKQLLAHLLNKMLKNISL